MFIENPVSQAQGRGWIEVICGSMFSGKTEELIRRLKRARIAGQKVEIFKPDIDKRYDEMSVVSHDERFVESTPLQTAEQMLFYATEYDVVGIDEAQFFDKELPEVCNKLADYGIRIIVAGLDMDFKGKPFGPMPELIATAEYVTKVHAICVNCGNLAHYSYRKVKTDELVFLGETNEYAPLCRKCYADISKDKNK